MICLKSQSWEEAELQSLLSVASLHCLREIDESALLWGPTWLLSWEQKGQGGRGPAGREAAAGVEMSEQMQALER